MRRLLCLLFTVHCSLFTSLCLAGDGVAPQTVTCTNLRDVASTEYAARGTYIGGRTILWTNCVAYSGGSTSSPVQGLSNVTVRVAIGERNRSTNYTGGVISPTAGTWWCLGTVPTNISPIYFQLTITDENTNTYSYPQQLLQVQDAL